VLAVAAAVAEEKEAAVDVVLFVKHGAKGRRFWPVVPGPLLLLRTRPWSRRLPPQKCEEADIVEGYGLRGVLVLDV